MSGFGVRKVHTAPLLIREVAVFVVFNLIPKTLNATQKSFVFKSLNVGSIQLAIL